MKKLMSLLIAILCCISMLPTTEVVAVDNTVQPYASVCPAQSNTSQSSARTMTTNTSASGCVDTTSTNTVWYKFTAPSGKGNLTNVVFLDTTSSAKVTVYNSSNGTVATMTTPDVDSPISFIANDGAIYYFKVQASGSAYASFNINVRNYAWPTIGKNISAYFDDTSYGSNNWCYDSSEVTRPSSSSGIWTATTSYCSAQGSTYYASIHGGIDIPSVSGTTNYIYAFADGEVSRRETNHGTMGNYIMVNHPYAKMGNAYTVASRNLHMSSLQSLSVGDSVSLGDRLGIMGATGTATGVHLHFGIQKINNMSSTPYLDLVSLVDPLEYFDEVGATRSTFIEELGINSTYNRSNTVEDLMLTSIDGEKYYDVISLLMNTPENVLEYGLTSEDIHYYIENEPLLDYYPLIKELLVEFAEKMQ